MAIFKWVGGVEIYPNPGWTTADSAGDSNTPFGEVIIISIGFLIVLATAIPFGFLNLNDNIYVQAGMNDILLISISRFFVLCFSNPFCFNLRAFAIVAFVSMLGIVLCVWTVDCFFVGLDFSRIPIITPHQGQLLGIIIFNFAFVTSVPSWVNEKVLLLFTLLPHSILLMKLTYNSTT